jgi:hypothetical protein
MSYDTGPCEGRQASPSNPSGPQTARLAETVVMRCTTKEMRHLKRRAATDKISVSELLREFETLFDQSISALTIFSVLLVELQYAGDFQWTGGRAMQCLSQNRQRFPTRSLKARRVSETERLLYEKNFEPL